MSRVFRLPALALAIALLPACGKPKEPAPSAPPAPSPAPAAVPAQSPATAAAPPATPSAAPKAEAPSSGRKAAVEAALQRYGQAVKSMDDEAISESFTRDGEMGTAGTPPIQGRGRIARHIRKMKDRRITSNVVTSESVSFSGDEAFQKGTFRQVATSPGGITIEASGRLEAVWVLESDGVWRLKKLTAFPDKPAEPARPNR